MKLRHALLAFSLVVGMMAKPMTAFAAHTHNWSSPAFYDYEDEMPDAFDDWEKCVTRHVYNYHQCLTCGTVEVYKTETIEMSHNWVNGACTYCNKGYAKK